MSLALLGFNFQPSFLMISTIHFFSWPEKQILLVYYYYYYYYFIYLFFAKFFY